MTEKIETALMILENEMNKRLTKNKKAQEIEYLKNTSELLDKEIVQLERSLKIFNENFTDYNLEDIQTPLVILENELNKRLTKNKKAQEVSHMKNTATVLNKQIREIVNALNELIGEKGELIELFD